MSRKYPHLTYPYMLLALIALAFFLSVGSGKAATDTGLPVYRSGTTFVYGNGSWETVLNATAERVEWKNHKGERYSGSPDFTRRPSAWRNRHLQVRRTYETRTDLFLKPPISLWPLRTGKKAGFLEKGIWTEEDGANREYSASWACEVVGRINLSVPAGTFDTWKIECHRYSVSSNLKSILRQVNTWFYSPDIGHYVLKESDYTSGKPSRRRELVAVTPPYELISPAVRQRIDKSFQAALEKNSRGESAEWQYTQDQFSGATKPTDTFRLANGTYCRRYAQTINQFQNQHTYYGLACRNQQGVWFVPRR